MSNPEGTGVRTNGEPREDQQLVRRLPTSRRTFVGLLGVLSVGTGSARANTSNSGGYGVGGYGIGGFGGSAYTIADYADANGVIRTEGVTEAVSHWVAGMIDTSLLLAVIAAWRSGEPVV